MDCRSAEEVELYPMDNENASKTEVEARRWWVLNHVAGGSAGRIRRAREAVDRLNVSESLDLELWAPSIVNAVDVGGRMIRREVALTYHYVFVRGRLRDVKRLCGAQNGFSFVIDRAGADRYAHVSEAQMTAFRIIARGYENRLPFFRIEDVELEDGDLVEVMDGAFAGLVGRFMARKGSSNGNIAVQTSGGLGTMAFNVDARSVRVLEFAAGSRRAYDQIDAFAPRLFAALRKMRMSEQLTDKEIASLTVFVRRSRQRQACRAARRDASGRPEHPRRNGRCSRRAPPPRPPRSLQPPGPLRQRRSRPRPRPPAPRPLRPFGRPRLRRGPRGLENHPLKIRLSPARRDPLASLSHLLPPRRLLTNSSAMTHLDFKSIY